MARVYLARDQRYDKHVAIKVLNPELSAALGQERFLREIAIVAHLNHPHILPLLDSGEANGSLFYVMPYVAGESLRHRLRRETQLPIADALAIARDVAGALDYAHREGFVHRDIKPENILMSEGLAIVADFGIARAITLAADDDRITQTGVSPGTPPYMSPEQASNGSVDGRSDIYALGCVLYEMLAGQPPFSGPTTQAILARHLADPVPSLRTVRKTVPVGVEQAVLKSLEKVPADRFSTAGEFAETLASPKAEPSGPDWVKLGIQIAAGVAVAAVVWFSLRLGARGGPGFEAGLDTTSYVIFPFERDSGLLSGNEAQLLADGLRHWSLISVVDPPRLRERLVGHANRWLPNDAAAIARGVGAGRFVLSTVSQVGDSLRIYSAVYRTASSGPPVHDATIRVAAGQSDASAAFLRLADVLLFGARGPGEVLGASTSTSSRPARQALERGLDSVYTWNLDAADSAFNLATHYDANFSQAYLWLALVRSWMEQRRSWREATTATWQSAAARAAAGRSRLSATERAVSDAIFALSRGEVLHACVQWKRLTETEPDFATWYSLANCLSRDDAVIEDRTSPSGWSFRSSYAQAMDAYVRALQLLPSIHRSLHRGGFGSVRRLMMTTASARRHGHALLPDTMSFAAAPLWQGDSLAFVPYRSNQVLGRLSTTSAKTAIAVRHQRLLFQDIATAWVTAFPHSADAVEALAISLEMQGDPAALDTIRRARAVATTPDEQVRASAAEVWLLVKFSVPGNLTALAKARVTADSLLAEFPPGRAPEPLLLASLAALTGHGLLSSEYCHDRELAFEWGIPVQLAGTAFPLLALGAVGGPPDSLMSLERRFDSASLALSPAVRLQSRMEWVARAASLAFPEVRLHAMDELADSGDYLLDAEAAFLRGDTARVQALFTELRSDRRFVPTTEVTVDGLYPEATLLAGMGNDRGAVAWLDPLLTQLATTPPQAFADPARAGAFVRALALRAKLAARLGDRAGAQRWSRTVLALWTDTDAFLKPLITELQRLAV